ncbi:MAG: glycosyltransferase family 1 protein [Patescibacteria group bacterium]
MNLDLNRAVKKCKKIFVPSHQVKQDILKYTEIQEDRVIVIPHGYSCKIQNPINKTHNRKKQILYIGRVEAKKNILNLIKAFEIFNQKYPEYILILAGKINQKYVEKNREVFKTKNIQLLGYVSEQKKYQLLADSACFAYVSMEEGFGIPILEAFEFNLPVVCSNMPVLREVGADACVYVNYNSLQEIVESIEKIILDQSLQNSLIQNGPKQLEKFNWQGVSKKYLEEILN